MAKEVKLLTYNIDGLPEQLDLKTLPWILRPIAWIYKLIKGTTIVTINDNGNKKADIEDISDFIASTKADFVGVQEDFNFHKELMSSLKYEYNSGTHKGGFDLSELFSNTEWLTYFPLPRFKSDGVNMISKKDRIKVNEETIVSWKKSCGYFKHANDALTHKGFRLYTVRVDDEVNLDVYVLHMDADFYNEVSCPDVSKDIKARESQLKQLTSYILSRYEAGNTNPVIIMGDTNSTENYAWDVDNINSNLLDPINSIYGLEIKEAVPVNFKDVDRIFYINNRKSPYHLELKECMYYGNAGKLSDHFPFTATFNIV